MFCSIVLIWKSKRPVCAELLNHHAGSTKFQNFKLTARHLKVTLNLSRYLKIVCFKYTYLLKYHDEKIESY